MTNTQQKKPKQSNKTADPHVIAVNKGAVSGKTGIEAIKKAVKNMTEKPGCYLMYATNGKLLYVGKAKRLKKRLISYTNLTGLSLRIQRMVSLVHHVEINITSTETEALLLESNLIKEHKPRFNILLRDDKRLPYIRITNDDFPQIIKYRGLKHDDGVYFGPFASVGAVSNMINTLQRLFLIRECSNSMFKSRKRPCLQYQIRRCSAPCVSYISQDSYAKRIKQAYEFLSGSNVALRKNLTADMEQASKDKNYELAADIRDRLTSINHVLGEQLIELDNTDDIDVIAIAKEGGGICLGQAFWRNGKNCGTRTLLPYNESVYLESRLSNEKNVSLISHVAGASEEEIITAFLGQFYAKYPVTANILVSHLPEQKKEIEDLLSKKLGRKVTIRKPQKGSMKKLIDQVEEHAKEKIRQYHFDSSRNQLYMQQLADLLKMDQSPSRIEVYDNSHIMGSFATSACVVFGVDGFEKNNYRIYNFRASTKKEAMDDYEMMRQTVRRRLSKSLASIEKDKDSRESILPDVMIIDGGKGQRSAVMQVLTELNLDKQIQVLAIAKGPNRQDAIFYSEFASDFRVNNQDLRFFIERLRDEAHRFVINHHRKSRGKSLRKNALDEVAGIGEKRMRLLLSHFGSLKEASKASVDDIAKIPGISKILAKSIIEHLRNNV